MIVQQVNDCKIEIVFRYIDIAFVNLPLTHSFFSTEPSFLTNSEGSGRVYVLTSLNTFIIHSAIRLRLGVAFDVSQNYKKVTMIVRLLIER